MISRASHDGFQLKSVSEKHIVEPSRLLARRRMNDSLAQLSLQTPHAAQCPNTTAQARDNRGGRVRALSAPLEAPYALCATRGWGFYRRRLPPEHFNERSP
ncbi:unnamed protein product [Lampetra planeri]